MTIWLATRHQGTIDWVNENGFHYDKLVSQLQSEIVQPGDTVLGTLPMNEAARICAKGATFWAFTMDMARSDRGVELTSCEIAKRNARFERFVVTSVKGTYPLGLQ